MTGQIILRHASSSSDYTKGLRFPNDPGTGASDTSGLRLYVEGAENQVLELYVGNDNNVPTTFDRINFATGVGGTPNNDLVTINGNKIWNVGNLANPQSAITLTTTGSSGAATLVGATLNIPNYGSALSGYLPLTGGTLTGALTGTSATFSSRVNINGAPDDADIAMTVKAPSGSGKFIMFGRDSSNIAVCNISSAGAANFTNATINGGNIRGNVDGTFAHQHYRASTDSFTATTINSVISGASAYLSFGTNSNWTNGNAVERIRITSDGEIQINNNVGNGVASTNFRVYGYSGNSFFRLGNNTSNSLNIQLTRSDSATMFSVDGHSGAGYLGASAWSYGSDKRIKENINYIETGLDKVLALKPAIFDYINGLKNNIGWIAQDIQKVIPEAVSVISEDNDQLTLKSDFIVPYLVKAIQEQQAQIEDLKAKLN
jgi:hypothetical protein